MQILHNILIILIVFSSSFVFLSENPVHSVLFLIFSLCDAAIILFLFNAEFLGFIFIIIYVGAIAVLFLFVIMMLNIKFNTSRLLFYFPFIFLIIVVFFSETFILVESSFSNDTLYSSDILNFLDNLTNITIIGQGLYSFYIVAFLIAGLILLVAIIGAICLTLNYSSSRKKELYYRQLSRSDTFLSFFRNKNIIKPKI